MLETIEEARQFKNKHQITNLIYEVEVLNNDFQKHEGEYDKFSPEFNDSIWDGMTRIAHFYWLGQNIQRKEVVINSPVKVIRTVD